VSFYQSRLAPLFRGAELDLSRWDEVAILTRAEAQRSTQALTARIVPPDAGAVDSGETSGSTGRPLRYLVNQLANVATLGATDRALRWWEFDGAKTMATFVARKRDSAAITDETTVAGWRVGFSGLHHMIPSRRIMTNRSIALSSSVRITSPDNPSSVGPGGAGARRGVNLRFERINSTSTALSDDLTYLQGSSRCAPDRPTRRARDGADRV
jgi:hypothetical protein